MAKLKFKTTSRKTGVYQGCVDVMVKKGVYVILAMPYEPDDVAQEVGAPMNASKNINMDWVV